MSRTALAPGVSPARPAADPSDFLLGDWLVQPGLNRLTRNGTALQVRPQLMDVLVCLAASPGRTVRREELLQRVWPGQTIVADTAIARCVAELRQVLGDHAAAPTHIPTVHKRGYRVIAPVGEPSAHASGAPHAPLRAGWRDRALLFVRQVAGALFLR